MAVGRDDDVWSNTWLEAILDALGVGGDISSVRFHFEYGMYATVTITWPGCGDITKQLPFWGTNIVSAALGAPRGLQAITFTVEENAFIICHCRYLPIEGSMGDFVAALQANKMTVEVA